MTKPLVIDGLLTIALFTFNADWLGWPDAPGGEDWKDAIDPDSTYWSEKPASEEEWEAGFGAQVDADLDVEQFELGHADQVVWDYEPLGEDVDFAQAEMVARCDEASWYRFVVA